MEISSFISGYLSYLQGTFRKIIIMNNEGREYEELFIYLSRILYYINDDRHYVGVSDEICFIRKYIRIQSLRFKNIEFTIEIGNEFYAYTIEKLKIFSILEEILSIPVTFDEEPLNILIQTEIKGMRKMIVISKVEKNGVTNKYYVKLHRKMKTLSNLDFI